ncbi:hypothetical protein BST63_00810 [Bradyrhizobium canariense]|uniref:Lipoprotein n=1 Tax=Bradyrhizobium canariense TaxID=255045 RepID=A0ABX3XBC2_9BRAD|nr:hypothetical protein BSR47_00705 [Bradyrhizobium canariense]OSJ36379.1 hypothetical protein BST63_00810 [Bradyrhizobium canariense]
MFKHLVTIAIFAVLLSGCAGAPPAKQPSFAWDGLGRDPNLHSAKRLVRSAERPSDPNRERDRVLATIRPYSDAWWVVHNEIQAENDRRLSSMLVICQGCIARTSSLDATGSIP